MSHSKRQTIHIDLSLSKKSKMLSLCLYMSRIMRKQMFCIGENKDADQLRGNHKADKRLCFRYLDSTIPLLPKYKILSVPSPVAVQPGLSQTWSEPTLLVFSCCGSYKDLCLQIQNILVWAQPIENSADKPHSGN